MKKRMLVNDVTRLALIALRERIDYILTAEVDVGSQTSHIEAIECENDQTFLVTTWNGLDTTPRRGQLMCGVETMMTVARFVAPEAVEGFMNRINPNSPYQEDQ
jgi:hypothetical protein